LSASGIRYQLKVSRDGGALRRRIKNPFILDESIDSLFALQRGLADAATDGINIKIARLGGLMRPRTLRDGCAANGIAMTIEDPACTDIVAAAVAHFAQSTPEYLRLSVSRANIKTSVRAAKGGPQP
jgi:cis-L-3-hydroxyproline dehydratase